MIVALDLDDTLYDEITFVRSGFGAVADFMSEEWDVPKKEALGVLMHSLEVHGRGLQFDHVLQHFDLWNRGRVASLVRVYRHHTPKIRLRSGVPSVLRRLRPRPLYLVTDGHKVTQANKIEALGLRPHFRHSYLTNRYGRRHQKPSPRVFQLLLKREACKASNVVYVGDNPAKDFCGIRPLGFRTIRILTGSHADKRVAAKRDAERTIESLEELPAIVQAWEQPQ